MQTGRCPKCGGSKIAVSTFSLYLGHGVSGPTLRLFACADCRYVEQYMVDVVESRVKLLDNWEWLQPDEGPFR